MKKVIDAVKSLTAKNQTAQSYVDLLNTFPTDALCATVAGKMASLAVGFNGAKSTIERAEGQVEYWSNRHKKDEENEVATAPNTQSEYSAEQMQSAIDELATLRTLAKIGDLTFQIYDPDGRTYAQYLKSFDKTPSKTRKTL